MSIPWFRLSCVVAVAIFGPPLAWLWFLAGCLVPIIRFYVVVADKSYPKPMEKHPEDRY